MIIDVVVPAGATVTATTGDGYKGVHMDEKAKGNVAEWLVPRIAPKDAKAFTISLSQAPAESGRPQRHRALGQARAQVGS